MQAKQLSPTDLTNSQQNLIKERLPKAKLGGRLCNLEIHKVADATLYLVVSGIQGQMLPKEYPKWKRTIIFVSGGTLICGRWQSQVTDTVVKKLVFCAFWATMSVFAEKLC